MPKRNEKLAAAGEEILALKLEIMALQNEVRQARRLERMKIAREILADEGEE